jgi:hypothetical protein
MKWMDSLLKAERLGDRGAAVFEIDTSDDRGKDT